MALRVGSPSMQNIVSGLIQAERTGSSLGPILRAQAHQLRSERFQRAEKQAMEAPVKLLAPLVLFISLPPSLCWIFGSQQGIATGDYHVGSFYYGHIDGQVDVRWSCLFVVAG